VIASNRAGAGRPATSTGVLVPVPKVKGCPAATGVLTGHRLGLVTLGQTRAQARHAYTKSSNRGKRYEDFFCLTPIGVRVGYGSPALVKTVPKRRRGSLAGRVVWASTSSGFYSVDAIRPGATIAAAGKLVKLTGPLKIGRNTWYLILGGPSTGILKTRAGIVQEIGIANPQLTVGHPAQVTFLHSFS
jgi:hypothetical protein